MYVPFLLGFRFGDRDADMSITGRELDLDNTKLGHGRREEEELVLFVLGLLVLRVWGYTRPARSLSGAESPTSSYQKFCRTREKWCMSRRLVQFRITHPNQPTFHSVEQFLEFLYLPRSIYLKPLITDPNPTLYPPLDTPLPASQGFHVRHLHMISSYLTLDLPPNSPAHRIYAHMLYDFHKYNSLKQSQRRSICMSQEIVTEVSESRPADRSSCRELGVRHAFRLVACTQHKTPTIFLGGLVDRK